MILLIDNPVTKQETILEKSPEFKKSRNGTSQMSRGSGSIHRADPNDSLTREPQTDRFLGRFERIGTFVDALVIGKFGNGHGAFDNARQEILSTVRAAIDRHRLPAAP